MAMAMGPPARSCRGTSTLSSRLGSEKLVHFRLDAERVSGVIGSADDDSSEGLDAGEIAASAATVGTARVAASSRLRAGDETRLKVDTERLHLFDPDSRRRAGGAGVGWDTTAPSPAAA